MILAEKWQKVIDQNGICRLVFEINMNKFAFKNTNKTEITFSLTQYKRTWFDRRIESEIGQGDYIQPSTDLTKI